MTKHDEKLLDILIMYLKHRLTDDQVIQQIKDAGWVHKSEMRLDEGKIANIMHNSDHPWYKDCIDCKNANFNAHKIAQAGGRILK